MRIPIIKFSLMLLVFSGIFQSCKKDDNGITAPRFSEIADIASFQGNLESDVIVVNTQGGPVTTLEDEQLGKFMVQANAESALWVNVHQAQTKNPELFTKDDITFEQAKTYDAESIANLKKVVDYFKAQPNKKVYVLGISFGAFMTQELIAKHGIDAADKYFIMVGRLDIEEEFWKGFSEGKLGGYQYDEEGNASFVLIDQESVEDRNTSRLAAGLGNNRYTGSLGAIDDLSKITYIYGTVDEQVGPLTKPEVDVLKNKGANVMVAEGQDHSGSINQGIKELKKIFEIK